jgi:hypothetical protein
LSIVSDRILVLCLQQRRTLFSSIAVLFVLAFACCFILPVPSVFTAPTPPPAGDKKKEKNSLFQMPSSFDLPLFGSKSPPPPPSDKKKEKSNRFQMPLFGSKSPGLLVNAAERLERGIVQHGDALAQGIERGMVQHGDRLERGIVQHGDKLAMGIVLVSSVVALAMMPTTRWTEVGNLLATCTEIIDNKNMSIAKIMLVIMLVTLFAVCLLVAFAILKWVILELMSS